MCWLALCSWESVHERFLSLVLRRPAPLPHIVWRAAPKAELSGKQSKALETVF